MHRLTAIDLFCGCGGLSVGLKKADFRIIAAIDADELAINTYRRNHRTAKVVHENIRKVSAAKLMHELRLDRGELDLLAGCPPCQGFSKLRTLNGKHSVQDSMNELIFDFLRFVRVFRPKTIMLENVPGLAKDERLVKFGEVLTSLKYTWKHEVLNAANFGVPQRRNRMILIASRIGPIRMAAPLKNHLSVRDVFTKLPPPGSSGDPLHDHTATRSEHVMEIIRNIPHDGGSRSALPIQKQLACHRKSDGFADIYGRMAWDEPSPTITGGCINPSKGRFLHPTADRAITLREAALLQGFPTSYQFSLDRGHYPAAQMIGNAFPPAFATLHARELAKRLVNPITVAPTLG